MSEPKQIGEILPEVLQNIKARCKASPFNEGFRDRDFERTEHTRRVLLATRDFMREKGRRRARKYRRYKTRL